MRRGKLDAPHRRVNFTALAVVAVCAVALSGCIRFARTVAELPDGEWTTRLGDAAHAPYLTERVPSTVSVAWEADLGRGLPVAPIIQQNLIVSAVSGGGVIAADARDGEMYWSRRFNGSVAGQVLRVGSQIYFATQQRNGSLYAMDLHRGRRSWSRRIGSAAAAEPAYADGRIYLGTHRELQAIDAANGSVLWRLRLDGPPAQPPLISGGDVFLVVRDTLFRVGRENGDIRGRAAIAGEPSAPLALRGDTLFIAMHPGIIAAYLDGGARELWRHTLDAPVLAAPVVTDDGVYALTRQADLYVIDPHASRRLASLGGAATGSLSITADGALIGTLDGRVIFVRRDGTVVWEQEVDGSVRAPAAVHDSSVYVGTLNGVLVKLTAE